MAKSLSGIVLWITGLPGSGKSTVADEIEKTFPEFVVIRMDEVRKIVTPLPTYSENERETVYRALVYLSQKLSDLGHRFV